jgi:Putative Flp pilus-assembly TadE/G-like
MRRAASDESGQALVMTAIAMTLMIIMVGLVVDVGHAMLVQRQLQAGVDAAALAGAQHLPDAPMAESVAMQYGPTPQNKNAVSTVGNATTTAKVSCLAGVPGCNRRDGGVNGIVVSAQSNVPTWFGRIIGITYLTVNATATACAPCSVKPLDIMVVLDRTGSMCESSPGVNDPNCTDLKNARNGVRSFVSNLDPSIDKVGLALFPPVLDQSFVSRCPVAGYKPWSGTSNPNPPPASLNGKYYGYDAYWPYYVPDTRVPPQTPSRYVVASLEGADGTPADDYLVKDAQGNWLLNDAQSAFLQRLGCTSGSGSTSYALSLEEAQYELSRNGRGNVQDVIIFLSDGAANTWPKNTGSHWSNSWGWGQRPCGMGVQAATNVKQSGTIIYTIGYDLDAGSGAPEKCRQPNQSDGHSNGGNPVESGYDAYTAIQAMASTPQQFYNKPNPGDLTQIFLAIARDLSASRGRLIDNMSPSLP